MINPVHALQVDLAGTAPALILLCPPFSAGVDDSFGRTSYNADGLQGHSRHTYIRRVVLLVMEIELGGVVVKQSGTWGRDEETT